MQNTPENNPYYTQIATVLPCILSFFNTEPLNRNYGVGDRLYWAWKLIDFANGTFQGAAHGLARLLNAQLLPNFLTEQATLKRIDQIFAGTSKIIRRDGSMEEAFPYESSYCVTALVAFDLLSALQLLESRLTRDQLQRYLAILKPLIVHLTNYDEHHALISNHLATATAALFKWALVTKTTPVPKAEILLKRILDHQSQEGWFQEYEGADPGYQTLCLHYLADLHHYRPDLGLAVPLQQATQFLSHFVHPDGSFGGLYGSRNTRFYYPSALEYLSDFSPIAQALARRMRQSISNHATVTLQAMDAANLIPMFNSYCWAASCFATQKIADKIPTLPAFDEALWTKSWPDAGFFIKKTSKTYTIVATKKGGVTYHFSESQQMLVDCGAIVKTATGQIYTTQIFHNETKIQETDSSLTLTSPLFLFGNKIPSPIDFLILRLLCITFLRFRHFNKFIKSLLVKYLITRKKCLPGRCRRTIIFSDPPLINDEFEGLSTKISTIKDQGIFHAIHMASQGYWQRNDTA